ACDPYTLRLDPSARIYEGLFPADAKEVDVPTDAATKAPGRTGLLTDATIFPRLDSLAATSGTIIPVPHGATPQKSAPPAHPAAAEPAPCVADSSGPRHR